MSAEEAKPPMARSGYPKEKAAERGPDARPSGLKNVPTGLVAALIIFLVAIAAMVIAVAILRPAGG